MQTYGVDQREGPLPVWEGGLYCAPRKEQSAVAQKYEGILPKRRNIIEGLCLIIGSALLLRACASSRRPSSRKLTTASRLTAWKKRETCVERGHEQNGQ